MKSGWQLFTILVFAGAPCLLLTSIISSFLQYIPLKKKFPGMKNPQERADLIAYLKEATTS